MQKSLLASLLLMTVSFTGNAQWNLVGSNLYTNGTVGIGTSAPPASHKVEIQATTDVSLLYLRQARNAGGSGDAIFFRDDRGYGGNNTGTTFKVESWRGLGFQGGSLVNFTTIDNGFYNSRFYINNDNGRVGIGTTTPQTSLDINQPNASVRITASNATGAGVGNPSLYINRISEGLKLEYVPNVLARISNTYVGQPGHLAFATSGQDRLLITGSGNVGIGTINPDAKLAVKGTIHAEEVKVDLNVPVPDYVFEKNYNLPTLTEVENYINQNKHLPEVPAAKEMETNGVNLGEMNMLLLKKVEELTLYVIELKKEIDLLKKTNDAKAISDK